jgi:hypothetical protein
MSQESIETVTRVCGELYAAARRGDRDAFVALHDRDATVIPLILGIEGGGYHGHDGIRRFWTEIRSSFPDWHWEVGRLRVFDQGALVSVRIVGHGKGSGVTIDEPAWHVLKLRHGKLAWWQVFRSQDEALEAAGLKE